MDKTTDILQCITLLLLVLNDMLMQRQIRALEKKLKNMDLEIIAEGIRLELEYQMENEYGATID